MSFSKNTLIKNSLFYVVLGFLPLATNVILAPLYSSYISPGEFGIIAIATIFQGFLAVFISLGLEGGFSRFYFNYHKKEKLIQALMSTTLLSIIASSVVFWIILYFAGDYIFRTILQNEVFTFEKYGNLVFITTFSTSVHAVFLSYYRNKEWVFAYSFVSLSFFFTSVMGILIGVVYFKAEAIGNISGRAFGTTLIAILLLLHYFITNGIKFKYDYLKEALIYSLPLIPYLLLLMAYNSIDKIMVEQKLDLDSLGLYNFAFLLASVLSVLIYAVFNAVSPRIYKLLTDIKGNSQPEVRKINVFFHLFLLGTITLAMAVIVPAIEIFISEKYQSIREYVGFLILVYIFQLYYVIYALPLFFYNKTKSLPWISLIIFIVGVIANLVFIPFFGLYGVCIALFITKLTQCIVAYLFIKHYGYHKYGYLSLQKNHIISVAVVISYVGFFLLNYQYKLFPVFIINVIPLIVFMIGITIFFRNDIMSFRHIFKKTLSSKVETNDL